VCSVFLLLSFSVTLRLLTDILRVIEPLKWSKFVQVHIAVNIITIINNNDDDDF